VWTCTDPGAGVWWPKPGPTISPLSPSVVGWLGEHASGVGPQLSLISGPCSMRAQHSGPKRSLLLAHATRIPWIGICRARMSEDPLYPKLAWPRSDGPGRRGGVRLPRGIINFLCTLGHEFLVCAQEGRLADDRGKAASRIRTSEKKASALSRCQM